MWTGSKRQKINKRLSDSKGCAITPYTPFDNISRYEEAAPLYERALQIFERALGPEHPHVAACLESYALFLRTVDRLEEAEPLEARARAIWVKHP